MSSPRPSPLLGSNTNLGHRGRDYHVQTEDSGVDRPHVITHLFADGGRIVATQKTGYGEHVDTAAYPQIVRQLIREQHAAMIDRLRAGHYDALIGGQAARVDEPALVLAAPSAALDAPAPRPPPDPRPPEVQQPAAPRLAKARARTSDPFGTEPASESIDEIITAELARSLGLDD